MQRFEAFVLVAGPLHWPSAHLMFQLIEHIVLIPRVTKHAIYIMMVGIYVVLHVVWSVSQCFGNTLQWRHNEHDGVSNHRRRYCLLSRLFGHRSKKTSTLRVTGLCVGNFPGTGESPSPKASNTENVSIWWRHHKSTLRARRCVLTICFAWYVA